MTKREKKVCQIPRNATTQNLSVKPHHMYWNSTSGHLLTFLIDKACCYSFQHQDTSNTVQMIQNEDALWINRETVSFLTIVILQNCVLLLLNRRTAKDKDWFVTIFKTKSTAITKLLNYYIYTQYTYYADQEVSHTGCMQRWISKNLLYP